MQTPATRFLLAGARRSATTSRFVAPAPTTSLVPRRHNATAVEPPRRKDWSREEIQTIYDAPLMDLIFRAVSSYLLCSLRLDDCSAPRADPRNLSLGLGYTSYRPAYTA